MFLLFAVIFGGVLTGRLLSGLRLGFVSHVVTVVIWTLLFLLGLEVGSDPAVVGGISTLGLMALVICTLSVAGSIFASWLLWRYICGRGPESVSATDVSASENHLSTSPAAPAETPVTMFGALRGSLIIILFFIAGCAVGLSDLVPFDLAGSRVSTYVLYVLMFSVGVTLGSDKSLAGRIRQLDPRLALLPVATAVGTLAGAALATPLIAPATVTDSLAVGAGFGYYSLSSIFIADLKSAELGTVALLCNVMREIFTLVAAPLVARWFGPLAAVSIGGATSFDTTLPVITRAAGRPYAVVSIFHGCALDFSVPFLVTLFCTL